MDSPLSTAPPAGLSQVNAPSAATTCAVVLIGSRAGKTPVVAPQTGVTPEPVKDMGGKSNDSFCYGTLGYIGSAVTVQLGHLDRYEKIATHEGESKHILHAVRGNGVLVNVDAQDRESSRFDFRTGDAIVFKPCTLHRREGGGPEGCEFTGIEQQAVQPR